MRPIASLVRQGSQLFGVSVVSDREKGDGIRASEVVAEGREYGPASQLVDALNYLFGWRGALAGLGLRASEEGGEVAGMAANIAARYEGQASRAARVLHNEGVGR